MRYLAYALLAVAPVVSAQELKLSVFDRLKDRCTDMTDINLPKNLIDVAKSFLPVDTPGDAARFKRLADGLSGVMVKSCEFDKEGAYTDADVKQLISELAGPGWNLIISSTENHGRDVSRIWIKAGGNGEVGGLRILSAEAKELAVVAITGRVRPEDIKDLGALGVPNILNDHNEKSPQKKNEE
ncbi:MAG TPA: DUF4252 domain-containing protein [Bryobacteraceae bacterium]|jgi:hypothetical protein